MVTFCKFCPICGCSRLGLALSLLTSACSLPQNSHLVKSKNVHNSITNVPSMTSNAFALAQQRLAARRQAREEVAQSRIRAQQEASRATDQLSRLPFPLGRIGRAGVTTWDSIRGREGTRPAFRVGQVDAELLDEELLELLKGQVGEALKYFGTHI